MNYFQSETILFCTPLIPFSGSPRSCLHLSSRLSNKVFDNVQMKVDDPQMSCSQSVSHGFSPLWFCWTLHFFSWVFPNQSYAERWEDENCMHNWILKYTEFENRTELSSWGNRAALIAEVCRETDQYLWIPVSFAPNKSSWTPAGHNSRSLVRCTVSREKRRRLIAIILLLSFTWFLFPDVSELLGGRRRYKLSMKVRVRAPQLSPQSRWSWVGDVYQENYMK